MKKEYSKPEIMFESFTMSTSIAAGCENKFGAPSRSTCGYENDDGDTIFVTGIGGACNIMGNEESKFNGLCYHVPVETNNLFNS